MPFVLAATLLAAFVATVVVGVARHMGEQVMKKGGAATRRLRPT
jgi:hypothetical protein